MLAVAGLGRWLRCGCCHDEPKSPLKRLVSSGFSKSMSTRLEQVVLAALAFALLVEHLDPGSAAARRGAPTLGRRNSRTADSASKEPESDSGRSNDCGLEERDAEPSDIAHSTFGVSDGSRRSMLIDLEP